MAGLQRSVQTFRRSGSSGLVWDDRFFSGDLNQMKKEEKNLEFGELRHSQSVGSIGMTKRNGMQPFRTAHVPPSVDPPSPEVSGCMLCGIFGRQRRRTKPTKPRRY